jgi:hypothetical protein
MATAVMDVVPFLKALLWLLLVLIHAPGKNQDPWTVAALMCHALLEDTIFESTADSSSMVVWQNCGALTLALHAASLSKACLVFCTLDVSCWASSELQEIVSIVGRCRCIVRWKLGSLPCIFSKLLLI